MAESTLSNPICSVPECNSTAIRSRGLCSRHYYRQVLKPQLTPPTPPKQRKASLSSAAVLSPDIQRRCSICNYEKPGNLFCRGLSRCKECQARIGKDWYEKNRGLQKLKMRARRYGITTEELLALGDTCGVCGCKPEGKQAHVDHSHATGKVRGILCQSCNFLIGQCRENPDILDKAKEYIAKHL